MLDLLETVGLAGHFMWNNARLRKGIKVCTVLSVLVDWVVPMF